MDFLATDAVVRALQDIGSPVVRVNTEDLPFSGVIDYSIGVNEPTAIFSERAATDWFSAVWYRRLRVPTSPAKWTPVCMTSACGRVEALSSVV